ncbi:rho GTPase-activating protein 19-like isoform X1 [Gadus chalcogrammus]|uniref:rho GTPase-activating protein 19-like isoform X1 n=1 Tax=Gadus chalcogrammus TaxID=1042646 RepID=UPI0024C369E3|nr:rho GTPase-activating protein 19-like isoform X1 [Gadus chalcogrammus]
MAADKEKGNNTTICRGTPCTMGIQPEENSSSTRAGRATTIIFNPDFFVEKLRHEQPEVFTELVLSNLTRLIDLPGSEFSELLGEEAPPKTPTGSSGGGFFRSFNFLKRKDKDVVFGTPLSEGSIAQIYQLIEYLSKNLQVEGLFRVPGNSVRQQTLRDLLNSGTDVDLSSGGFHPNDVATLLKAFLGELPEPLLTHRQFHAHLKIADMTRFDERGNKTSVPDKERQIEALQLLLMLLPAANRSLLKLLLELLYHTAKRQDTNKMSAYNLALMFAPHVLWPRYMTAVDLKDNLKKLNNSMAFLIRHSQKLFRAPAYMREHARVHCASSRVIHTKDDLELLPANGSPVLRSPTGSKRPGGPLEPIAGGPQHHTEEALKELFRHVHHNMPDSAKKKKLIQQIARQTEFGTPPPSECQQTPPGRTKKHPRSRSFGALMKRKARGDQLTTERKLRHISPVTMSTGKPGKENVVLQAVNSPLMFVESGKACGAPKSSRGSALSKERLHQDSKGSPSTSMMCFSPPQEISSL